MMRFHLDEHVALGVASGLRRRGIDVTTTADAGLLDATDEDHLAFALREDRVIFTQDRDFLRIAARGDRRAGIIYAAQGSRTIGEVVRFLTLMHDCLTGDDIRGRIEYL
jgi:predicted nuclease of predicted toxin-antitoxin system